MDKIKTNIPLLILFLFTITFSACSDKPDAAIDEFEKSRPDGVKAFYAYPSTIRMLAQIMETSDINALEEVEKARLFISWKDEERDHRDAFKRLEKDIELSSFEELISFNSKDSDVRVFLNDQAKRPLFLLFSYGSDVDYLIEIEGEISIQTLQDIGTMDLDNVMDIVDLGKPKEKEEIETDEDQ